MQKLLTKFVKIIMGFIEHWMKQCLHAQETKTAKKFNIYVVQVILFLCVLGTQLNLEVYQEVASIKNWANMVIDL